MVVVVSGWWWFVRQPRRRIGSAWISVREDRTKKPRAAFGTSASFIFLLAEVSKQSLSLLNIRLHLEILQRCIPKGCGTAL